MLLVTAALASGWAVQKVMTNVCPTPIGLGAKAMNVASVMVHEGVCARASGVNIVEAVIVSIKIMEIATVNFLFLEIFMFFFFLFAFSWVKKTLKKNSYPNYFVVIFD